MAAKKVQKSLQVRCADALKKGGVKTFFGASSGYLRGGPAGVLWGVGKAAITSAGDVYVACSAADHQQEKADEFLRRRNSAYKWVEEQRAILESLRLELANSGCAS